MFDTLAAGLVIRAKDRASGVLRTIGNGFDTLKDRGSQLKAQLTDLGGALRTMGKAGLVVAGMFGAAGYAAAEFEQQVATVRSVMQGVTDEEFAPLVAEMKRLGATTSFTAKEAGEGAEFLARAGFNAAEQTAALSGVLSAAAADGMALGAAANVVANNVRSFGLEASQASYVADVLALTSSKTNTDISQLGEALRYVSSTAAQMDIPIQHTAAALGLLANAGLQGSIGGTSLNNMLLKLADVSDDNAKKLNSLGIQIQDTGGNLLPLPQLVRNIAGGIDKIPGNLEKAKLLMDLFGIRGQKAAGNLAVAFDKMNKDGANGFNDLFNAIENAGGAAERMAKDRLNSLYGSIDLLTSAMEGLSIELLTPAIKGLSDHVRVLADAFSLMTVGAQQADAALIDLGDRTDAVIKHDAAMSIAEFGAGLRDFADDVRYVIDVVGALKTAFINDVGEKSSSSRSMGYMVGLGLTLTAAFGLLAGVVGVAVLPILAAAAIGFKAILIAAVIMLNIVWPLIVMFGAFAAYVSASRQEGQTFGERMIQVFQGLWAHVSGFFSGFRESFEGSVGATLATFPVLLQRVYTAVSPIFDALGDSFGFVSSTGESAGSRLGTVFGTLLRWGLKLTYFFADFFLPVMTFAFTNFAAPIIRSIGLILAGFFDMLTGAKTVREGIETMFKGMVVFLMNTVLQPIKILLLAMIEGGAAIGAIGKAQADRMRGSVASAYNLDTPRVAAPEAPAPDAPREDEAFMHVKRRMERGNQDPNVNVNGQVDTKVEGCINNSIEVDGKNLAVATSEAEFELSQRSGFTLSPFLQTQIVTNGNPAR